MQIQSMTDRIRTAINSTNGRIFTVTFRKRSDGTLRTMNARLGVKSHLNPAATPDPNRPTRDKQHDLVTVFDVQSEGYSCIPLDSIHQITLDGQTFSNPEAV